MHIKEIKAVNFRNYSKLELSFSKDYNIIYGKNAQGKTNIIEALFLCSSGRSHRTKRDEELLKFDEENYYIKLVVDRRDMEKTIEIFYRLGERKRIKINDVYIKKNGELMGQLNTVLFSPEHMSIIKEGPSERRRFVDIAISQVKPAYFYDLQEYSRVLSQRNHLLKELKRENGGKKMKLKDTLEIWNEKLAETGSRIMYERHQYIKRLNLIAKENHKKLTGGREEIEIMYVPSFYQAGLPSVENIKVNFLKSVERDEEKELSAGVTLYGPQRDDIKIKVNNKNVRIYGSQGQQRTSVLTLKLSEINILRELAGENPVLLLDDVFSELDSVRQEYIIECIKDVQTFITSTDRSIYERISKNNANIYYVENGRVIREEDDE
ncbi:MAG: DNA replication/repair protein RecF [Clostridiaceae bacterium]|nr:DNA replication/repair protein RecF [Clostridiaceae bacterium]